MTPVTSPARLVRRPQPDPLARPAEKPSPASWGHWIVLALILGGIAAALLVQRELVVGPAPASAAKPASSAPGSPVLAQLWGRPATVRAQPGTVSLTFGGGSGTDSSGTHSSGTDLTPRIVSALGRLAVPATFFVQGDQVAAQRDTIRRALAAHDDVGMTGYTGADLARVSGWRLTAELGETQHRLLSAGGPGTALVRPPGATTVAALTAGTAAAARRLEKAGYLVVLADRSAQDATSPAAVLRDVLPAGPPAPGQPGLVLTLPDSGRAGAAALAALPQLASELRSAGYRFTTITTAFHLTVRPVRQSALIGIGEEALLVSVRAGRLVSTALDWAFFFAAALVISRLALLISTGAWHKIRARRQTRPWHDPVSVIIPAYNERAGIERCLRSMLDCDYPRLEVILVDDGSTDATAELVQALSLPVTIVSQPNAGKAAALNTGVLYASHDVLIFADGDTVFEPTTIARLVAPFRDPSVGAVAGNVKVANRRRLIGLIQHAEYVVGSSLDRRMYDVLNCMVTIPGAVGAFRRTALADVSGVPTETLAEDTDLTIAVGRAGWRIRYAAQARAWTEAPATVRQLWSQRHRWNYGTLQALWKYRHAVVAPRGRRALAWIGLPYLFAMGCVLPLISPAADLYVLFNLWNSPRRALTLWTAFLLTQGTLTVCAFAFDRERLRYLWTLPFQQVFYRQLMYLIVIHSMATALTGVRLRWHKLARLGVEVRQG
jgi:cellulose synthase/poly-beta-1,6-N-acetylglucosamine synthase-like glycosyltransferase/peptidoglycan/xylan/chitin deacetylase (PgdA/CDA1 family)